MERCYVDPKKTALEKWITDPRRSSAIRHPFDKALPLTADISPSRHSVDLETTSDLPQYLLSSAQMEFGLIV